MKRLQLYLLFTCLCFIIFVPQVSARSLSIDDVHIRVWISPNGDLLVNEAFTYMFNGEYSVVRRSIHSDYHDGVENFEAYELINPNTELGAMTKEDLRALDVSLEKNHYFATLPAQDEQKTIVYVYILKNAVKSYEAYSDLTIPFFGTGQNHDVDLHDVTIDLVFPETMKLDQYHAYFHDAEGTITHKSEELVRFFTPHSKAYQLTETRLLFPSAIMSEQAKSTEPIPLEKAIAQEENLPGGNIIKQNNSTTFAHTLMIASGMLVVAAIMLLLLPQRRLKREASLDHMLQYDPLDLYMIDRAGVYDSYAFFAGVYSLVERGYATAKKTATITRLQREPEAPNHTLTFTFNPPTPAFTKSEKLLMDWLFSKRVKQGIRIFFMNKLYGATATNKKRGNYHSHNRVVEKIKKNEKLWMDTVLEQMTEAKQISGTFYLITIRIFMILAVLAVCIAYLVHPDNGFWMIVYLILALFSIKKAWPATNKRRIISLFAVSIIAGFLAVGTELLPHLSIFLLLLIIVFMLTPRYILSRELAERRAEIRHFKAVLAHDGIPEYSSDQELEKWMTRAILLKVKKFPIAATHTRRPIEDISSTAPLASLVLTGEEPIGYLIKTWNWSKAPGSFFDSFFAESDSNSGWGGDSGGGGGDGGGGDGGGGAGGD
ncbi:DUF2207 domain-containing protein [Bacillus sp. FJAT-50079]|uniref:DUF2207 domain-containing protein n=1 Tax=Bacillus sp. FJAT-50079 TaxID=2833577 RepID=UPI001BC990F8|nr:DUF2207 domain-containing protein [Bacillus sp. FJAT-50079]MBS4210205.1 DUF2207 domain-containing protein [Bacillus sp. FJAT-50079]